MERNIMKKERIFWWLKTKLDGTSIAYTYDMADQDGSVPFAIIVDAKLVNEMKSNPSYTVIGEI
tara:strand:- start:535 stop:726 length:192 start_codon:yes stop_codon:yes gene_type:complete